jgi:hypothetical protein
MLAPEVQATTIAIRVPLALDRSQCRKILRYTPGHWPFQNLCTSLPKLRATQMLAPSKATPVEPPLALKLPIIWPSLARNSCSPVPSVSQMLSSTKCRSRLLNRNHLLGSPSGRTGTSQLCETIAVRRSMEARVSVPQAIQKYASDSIALSPAVKSRSASFHCPETTPISI